MSTPTTIETRLTALETSNRRMRLTLVAILTFGVCVGVMGQTSGPSIQPTITCRGVKVVDTSGRVRASMICTNGAPAIRMYDAAGAENANYLPNGWRIGAPHGASLEASLIGLNLYRDDHFYSWQLDRDSLTFWSATNNSITLEIAGDTSFEHGASGREPSISMERLGGVPSPALKTIYVDREYHFP